MESAADLQAQLDQVRHELAQERAHALGFKSKALMLQDELDEKNQEIQELRSQLEEKGIAVPSEDAEKQFEIQVKINKNLATKVMMLERELAEAKRKAAQPQFI